MKKVITLLLSILIMIFAFVGCQAPAVDNLGSVTTEKTTSSPEPTDVFVKPNQSHIGTWRDEPDELNDLTVYSINEKEIIFDLGIHRYTTFHLVAKIEEDEICFSNEWVTGKMEFYENSITVVVEDCIGAYPSMAIGTYEFTTKWPISDRGIEFDSNGDGTCCVRSDKFCADSNIIIPSVAPNGDVVTSVGIAVFYGNDSLVSVSIPSSVVIVDEYAFCECKKLTTVSIPKSVKSLSYYAFKDCTALDTITYSGTMEEWNAIEKASSWDEGVYIYKISCIDGVIEVIKGK